MGAYGGWVRGWGGGWQGREEQGYSARRLRKPAAPAAPVREAVQLQPQDRLTCRLTTQSRQL